MSHYHADAIEEKTDNRLSNFYHQLFLDATKRYGHIKAIIDNKGEKEVYPRFAIIAEVIDSQRIFQKSVDRSRYYYYYVLNAIEQLLN